MKYSLLLASGVLFASFCPGFVEFEAEVELLEFGWLYVFLCELVVTHTFILA
jgi:hypothetical protein